MSRDIKLLPDQLANQIAAGEVIQRPASVVKELVENAIDAGATDIQVVIEEAGKKLIQVIDNGVGMNPFNLRMCFQRHATSKIRKIDDLFSISTKGFRGEALPSIAAVAQVEVRSKTTEEELGTELFLENSEVVKESLVAMSDGTNFSIKNLFYNVPARRKFLKSDNVEFRHISEEFIKITLAHPQLNFKLFHNGREQFHLTDTSYKNRIISVLGSRYESQLIPVEEDTDIVTIGGFVGGPKAAIKTRGNQYLFVNNRFFRSPYLHHAIMRAYEDIIEPETFPFYVLYLELDPEQVDFNVHPTKQEVKFENDSLLYAYINAAVKHALAKFNIRPSLDFDLDEDIESTDAFSKPMTDFDREKTAGGMVAHSFSTKGQSHYIPSDDERSLWRQQRKGLGIDFERTIPSKSNDMDFPAMPDFEHVEQEDTLPVQQSLVDDSKLLIAQQDFIFKEPYIISTSPSGIVLFHGRRVLQRVMYEKQLAYHRGGHVVTRQLLFPVDISVAPSDANLLKDNAEALRALGYAMSMDEKERFQLDAVPIDLPTGREQELIDDIIEQLKYEQQILEDEFREEFLKSYVSAIASFRRITKDEVPYLIEELFKCEQTQYSPSGKKIFSILNEKTLLNLLLE